MQRLEQATDQEHPQRVYSFKPGMSGNPLGRSNAARAARLAAKVAELSVEIGGVEKLGAIDRVLLEQAAALLLRRPKTYVDQVRTSNAVQRILRGIAKRHGLDARRMAAPAVPAPPLNEMVERVRNKEGGHGNR